MKIGWIRPTRRLSADRQREDLKAAGVELAEHDWEIARQHVRPGDEVAVLGLHILAPDERTLVARLRDIMEFGGVVLDLATGQTHAPHTLLAWGPTKRAWQTEKRCLDPKEMRRRGKKGGRPALVPKGSPAERLIKAMAAMDKGNAEIIEEVRKLHGIEIKDGKTIAKVLKRPDKGWRRT